MLPSGLKPRDDDGYVWGADGGAWTPANPYLARLGRGMMPHPQRAKANRATEGDDEGDDDG